MRLVSFALSSLLVAACAGAPDSSQDVSGASGSDSGSDSGGMWGGGGGSGSGGASSPVFAVTDLVSNETDPDLVNPWGIVGGEGVFWIANNGSGKVSVYDGMGMTSKEYPTGHFSLGEGITGVAHNEDEDAFLVKEIDDGGTTCPNDDEEVSSAAELIFASEEGKLIAINDDTPASGTVVVDRSAEAAIYLGDAIIEGANGPLLLANDFRNARIDVFDTKFHHVSSTMFADPQMPEGFGPFNVRAIGDRVYVMYAKESDEPGEEEAGPGLGAVTVFDTSGNVVGRIAADSFNAPWAATVIGDTLFIGNFGDGHISMFDVNSLDFRGQVSDQAGTPIALEGLWGLEAGSDDAGAEGVLYFVAGPEDETAGLFGRIEPVLN